MSCGECTMCCKTHAVEEIAKPKMTWCQHCAKGEGCTIYDTRPQSCRDFNCAWLMSQSEDHPLSPELRPDRCGVVLSTPEDMLVAHVNDGVTLEGTQLAKYLDACKERGFCVVTVTRKKTQVSNPTPKIMEILKRLQEH